MARKSLAGPAQQFGPYRITHLVGRGGMATVFRAVRAGPMGFSKEVAIKKINTALADDENQLQAFINEARIGGQLHHPNIVEVYEFDQVGSTYYLAMEFVDGWTLDTVLRLGKEANHLMPPGVMLDILIATCKGLYYAHRLESLEGRALNLIHRDVKPSNIIVGRKGQVKVMDFGIAKADINLFQTQADITKGTPHYMSPEQVKGEPLTARSDLFSFGAIIYELCAGHVLFKGDNLATVLYAVVNSQLTEEQRQQIDARVPNLGEVAVRCLQSDPAERYNSAGEVAEVLSGLRAHFPMHPSVAEYMRDLRHRVTGEDMVEDDLDTGLFEPRFATMFAPRSGTGGGLSDDTGAHQASRSAATEIFESGLHEQSRSHQNTVFLPTDGGGAAEPEPQRRRWLPLLLLFLLLGVGGAWYGLKLPPFDDSGGANIREITPPPTPPPQTVQPTVEPTGAPTAEPTLAPTAAPTAVPTSAPTQRPTPQATARPTPQPSFPPLNTPTPTAQPTATPSIVRTPPPTPTPQPAGSGYGHLMVRRPTSEGRAWGQIVVDGAAVGRAPTAPPGVRVPAGSRVVEIRDGTGQGRSCRITVTVPSDGTRRIPSCNFVSGTFD